jgi:hypothetical protein
MNEKIYEINDYEYVYDGYLIINNEEYYSLKTFKEHFAINYTDRLVNNEKTNDIDSNEIKKL